MPLSARNLLNRPCILWGVPDNFISGYVTSGSVTEVITTDPLLSGSAYTLTANGLNAYDYKTFTTIDTLPIEVTAFVSQGSAATCSLLLDGVANPVVSRVDIMFTAGVPSVAVKSASGTANVYSPVSVGNGWYMIRQTFPYMTASQAYQIQYYPGGYGVGTGATNLYMMNTMLIGFPLYKAVADSVYRKGSEFYQASSGVEDSWVLGVDMQLQGSLQGIPPYITDTPYPMHGFYGYNESTGVDCGLEALLENVRTRQIFWWCQDSANIPNTNVPSYIFKDSTKLDDIGYREVDISIRNPYGIIYEGY